MSNLSATRLLYTEAVPSLYLNGVWLIVPTLEPDGRYNFLAFDPEGQDWCNNHWTRTYTTAEQAIAVGKAYIALMLVEMEVA